MRRGVLLGVGAGLALCVFTGSASADPTPTTTPVPVNDGPVKTAPVISFSGKTSRSPCRRG